MSDQLRGPHLFRNQTVSYLRLVNHRLNEAHFNSDGIEIMTITLVCLVLKYWDLRRTSELCAKDVPALQTDSYIVCIFAQLHIRPVVESVLPLCRLCVHERLHHF